MIKMVEAGGRLKVKREIRDYKVGEFVRVSDYNHSSYMNVCNKCHSVWFLMLANGTMFCQRCRRVVGFFSKENPKLKKKEKKEKVEEKTEDEPQGIGKSHCDKHSHFIPNCKNCKIAYEEVAKTISQS